MALAYGDLLLEDLELRKMLEKRLAGAGVSRIIIERPAKKARITIHSARPGVVIGKKGADIEKLRSEVASMTGSEVSLNIVEVRKPEIDAAWWPRILHSSWSAVSVSVAP